MKELLLLKMSKLSAEVAAFTACANRELSLGDWQCDWQKEILEVLREFDEVEADYLKLIEPFDIKTRMPPEDGTHFLAINRYAPNHFGPGVPQQAVVHFHKDGFYTSVNETEPEHPFAFTHWRCL